MTVLSKWDSHLDGGYQLTISHRRHLSIEGGRGSWTYSQGHHGVISTMSSLLEPSLEDGQVFSPPSFQPHYDGFVRTVNSSQLDLFSVLAFLILPLTDGSNTHFVLLSLEDSRQVEPSLLKPDLNHSSSLTVTLANLNPQKEAWKF